MNKLLFGLAALLLSTATIAGPVRLDVPYVPSDEVKNKVNTAWGWVELYKVDAAEQAGALKALVEKSKVPPALAVGIEGKLHFSQDGAESELTEVSLDIKRKGADIDYDNDCKVVPRAGDVLEWTYRSNDGLDEVVTKVTVREHHAFGIVGEVALEPIRLTLTKKEHCDAVAESRILGAGTLTYKHKGKVRFREPVLVQSISAP